VAEEVVKFSITGTEDVARKLRSLPPIVARQIIRNSLKTAVEPWKEQMIARVQRGWHVFRRTKVKGVRKSFAGRSREFGVIARNIRVRMDIGAGGFEGTAYVYPAKGEFWSKFLEFGTKRMRRFPFVEASFEAGKNEVLAKYIADVRTQLHKEMALR
jgi:HK97 gp10 family phage protein